MRRILLGLVILTCLLLSTSNVYASTSQYDKLINYEKVLFYSSTTTSSDRQAIKERLESSAYSSDLNEWLQDSMNLQVLFRNTSISNKINEKGRIINNISTVLSPSWPGSGELSSDKLQEIVINNKLLNYVDTSTESKLMSAIKNGPNYKSAEWNWYKNNNVPLYIDVLSAGDSDKFERKYYNYFISDLEKVAETGKTTRTALSNNELSRLKTEEDVLMNEIENFKSSRSLDIEKLPRNTEMWFYADYQRISFEPGPRFKDALNAILSSDWQESLLSQQDLVELAEGEGLMRTLEIAEGENWWDKAKENLGFGGASLVERITDAILAGPGFSDDQQSKFQWMRHRGILYDIDGLDSDLRRSFVSSLNSAALEALKEDGVIDEEDDPVGQSPGGSDDNLNDSIENSESDASYMEKVLADIVTALPVFLMELMRLQDPMTLVFQEEARGMDGELLNTYTPTDELYFYTFTSQQFEVITFIYEKVMNYIPYALALMLVLVGAGLLFSSFGSERVSLKEKLTGIVVAFLALFFGPTLMNLVFQPNRAVVLMFRDTFSHIQETNFFKLLWYPDTSSLGLAIITFIMAISVGILNWQYIWRTLVLGVLIFLFPFVAAVSVIKKQVLDIWIREFMANVFLQSAHAIVFAFFVLWLSVTEGTAQQWLTTIIFAMGINTLTMLIRRLVGAETLGGGMAATGGSMLGLGSLLSMGSMVMAATGGGLANRVGIGARGVNSIKGGDGGDGGFGSGGTLGGAMGAMATTEGKAPALPPVSFGKATPKTVGLQGFGKTAKVAGTLAQAGGIIAGGMAGGMLSGAISGNPAQGMAAGGGLGIWAGDKMQQRFNNASQFAHDVANESIETGVDISDVAKERLGIYDAAQFYDYKTAGQIGKNIAGVPGQALGMAVGHMTRVGYFDPLAVRKINKVKTMQQNSAQSHQQAIEKLSELTPKYNIAKEHLNVARTHHGEESTAFANAKQEFNSISAQMSNAKIQQMQAQTNMGNDYIKKEFERLRNLQADIPDSTHETVTYGGDRI